MDLGVFWIGLTVSDLEASRHLREARLHPPRRRPCAQLPHPQERRPRHRPVPGHVRQEHPHVQPGVGRERPAGGPLTDVRELQRRLRAEGVTFVEEADETTTGPAHFIVTDPDGNPILVGPGAARSAPRPGRLRLRRSQARAAGAS